MALQEGMEAEGRWLFQRRSFLPALWVVGAALVIGCESLSAGQPPAATIDWRLSPAWIWGGLALSGLGLALRGAVVGCAPRRTSTRSTKHTVAEQLNTRGLYSVVRHPLYLANFLIWLGMFVTLGNAWLTCVFCLTFWLYYERIMLAEEAFLRRKFGQEFVDWAARTPAFLPRWGGGQPPPLPFSWRQVCKREYTALLGTAVAFAALEGLRRWRREGDFPWDQEFACVLAALSLIALLAASFWGLKRYTRLLHTPGR